MQIKCDACGCEQECPEQDGDSTAKPLPDGWFIRHIDYTDYTLCDVCGSASHFRGGLSAYLIECLDLDPDAQCDVSSEVAILREERRAVRKKRRG
jgi:hypothetical protein